MKISEVLENPIFQKILKLMPEGEVVLAGEGSAIPVIGRVCQNDKIFFGIGAAEKLDRSVSLATFAKLLRKALKTYGDIQIQIGRWDQQMFIPVVPAKGCHWGWITSNLKLLTRTKRDDAVAALVFE